MTRCTDAAWHKLWSEYHKNPFDTIYLPVGELQEVIECHRSRDPDYKFLAIFVKTPAKTAKHAQVRREAAFKFLVDHGRLACDRQEVKK